MNCPDCGHSLEGNQHGIDQNDVYMDDDKLVYRGSCTYCKECNPRLKELAKDDRATRGGVMNVRIKWKIFLRWLDEVVSGIMGTNDDGKWR